MKRVDLVRFQDESNRIEGIFDATRAEVDALAKLLEAPEIKVEDLVAYVKAVQPDAVLRDTVDIPLVRVGDYVAPPSGPDLMQALRYFLTRVNAGAMSPLESHTIYETLHPFTDGNGRSGRALWLWMRKGEAPLGFLHQFYYDVLSYMNK